MKLVRTLLTVALSIALVYALNRSWGPVPALGDFLNPFTGFWQNGERQTASQDELTLKPDSLREEVLVRFDDTGVPHIFAKNDFDLSYAQGYVTARDRLWQMELQVRAASGRLAEVFGPAALELDRNSRKLGMGYGAETNFKLAMSDPRSRDALLGYTAGINAYINSLKAREYPFEYKLLGYFPEQWKPIHSMYMLEQMTLTLAGKSNDLRMSAILKQYGKEVVDQLFPNYPMLQESPVIPSGTPWNFTKLPIISAGSHPDSVAKNIRLREGIADTPQKIEGLGSNNWAVSGEKSITGYPILANDPHLELTLPSIWYQVQLHAPGVNVYGVSLPGIPGVIIGFNQYVAWGVTNVDADVYDLYKIRFKDASQSAYWHDGQWKPTRKREELIYVKGKVDPVREEIIYTHHGPVTESSGKTAKTPDLAVKWIGHVPGNGFLTFYELNRAKDYNDYRKALEHYVGPAQNFVFADNGKNIAMTVNGKFPLKYKEQGKYLLDGTNPDDDWKGWIPADQNPHVRNPPRGFVSSANQSSTDPTYPYYINWEFAPSERAIRINERLEAMQKATADSLRNLQNDNFNVAARTILPQLLSVLQTTPLPPDQQAAKTLLDKWNYQNDPGSIPATIFETWLPVIREMIWADEFDTPEGPKVYPSRDRTEYLILKQPDARWFDNINTPKKETMPDIVRSSFKSTIDALLARHGSISPAWEWTQVKGTEIRHLSKQLKPLNAPKLRTGGGGSIVNAITKRHGPSWRMVVELGTQPKAFGIYPGGQSGNPGSPYYLNLLEKWEKGQLNPLLFLQSQDEKNPRLLSTLRFKKD